ncbi:hypothetical protein X975_06508, partial [Stegodyphus mimosarum]
MFCCQMLSASRSFVIVLRKLLIYFEWTHELMDRSERRISASSSLSGFYILFGNAVVFYQDGGLCLLYKKIARECYPIINC